MGGSGKTTLVANTNKSQNLKKHFDCYAWITVSQTHISVEDLLRTMIQELFRATIQAIPLDFSNMSYVRLVEVLVDYLEPKRYLIVLYDVWDINLWRQINVALPNGTHGSRVMLTTRNEGIASFSFGVGSRGHHVQPLTDDEAWDLFSMKAFSSWDDSSCPTEFKLIAEDLVGKCQGLPLGIVAWGSPMSTKRIVPEWTKVYNGLNWELSNNPTLEVVKSILLLSFNDLSYQLKNFFLHFCIFPEDYAVQCKRLIRLWMAEGFVEQVRGAKPEDIAESHIAEFTCRCMLQVVRREPSGRAKTFKMHDLLRELALSISETEKFCTTYMEQEETNEEIRAPRRLTVQVNYGELRMKKNMSKVRTIFTFSPNMAKTCSTLENLPSGFESLRVLDVKDAPIIRLPHEMVKLYSLKYLNLRGTNVAELPEGIGNLHNLETLDIRKSKILVLPVGTVKLKNSRHLLLYHHQKYDPKSFNLLNGTQVPFGTSELKSLQVLDGMEGGGMLIKQLGHRTQLTRLILTNVRDIDEEDLCMSIERMKLVQLLLVKTSNEDEVLRLDALPAFPPLLETLALAGKLEKVPLWFPSLQSLTTLNLHWSRLEEDLLSSIETLPSLTELRLRNAHIGKRSVLRIGFQKLAELFMVNFPQLNMNIH